MGLRIPDKKKKYAQKNIIRNHEAQHPLLVIIKCVIKLTMSLSFIVNIRRTKDKNRDRILIDIPQKICGFYV
jgi:hypothetical protein